MEAQLDGVHLDLVQGDITSQQGVDAVVNAANAQLMPGGGVAGAIHRAAGPELAQECRPLAPIRPGDAVITRGHQLPNPHVVHCLGPVYRRDEPSDRLLADCYRNALRVADEEHLRSIAFPAISTGAFGYPMEAAARVALRTVLDQASHVTHVRHIRFVLYGKRDLEIHEGVLNELLKTSREEETT